MGLASALANPKPMVFRKPHRETHGPPILEPERYPGALRRSNNVGDLYAPGTKAHYDNNLINVMKPKQRYNDYTTDDLEEFDRSLRQQAGAERPQGLSIVQRARQEQQQGEQVSQQFMQKQLQQAYPERAKAPKIGKIGKTGRISKDAVREFDASRRQG